MLELIDVNKTFENKAVLSGFNMTLGAGEKVLLKGPSGAGKSTIFNLILAFLKPDSGELYWEGKAYSTLDKLELRRSISWTPQGVKLFNSGTSIDNINSIFQFKRNKAVRPEFKKIITIAERLSLSEELLNKEYLTLSGGESQRVSILISILLNRKLILMDEPTSALDPQTADSVMNTLLDTNSSVLCISHSADFDARFDRIVQLEKASEK
jgi:putative ABC transport system ATP-binding protein